MRLAITQPGAQSGTAMGLIAPSKPGMPCLACVGRRRSLAIAQSHLQMLCTGVHEQPAGEMLQRAAAFAAAQHPEPGAVAQATSQFGQVRPRPRLTAPPSAPRRRYINLNVAATTCREGGIQI